MTTYQVRLVDANRRCIGTAHVVQQNGGFEGTADLQLMPAEMAAVFSKFEAVVNGQMFSLLDESEQAIDDLQVRVVFPSGEESLCEELQLMPGTGHIRFRAVGLVANRATG